MLFYKHMKFRNQAGYA